jgi:spermidine synthase
MNFLVAMHNRFSLMPFIAMGFISMLLQITVLRLLLSTFSGNELDIGITLSFWLIFVGLGSYAGRKLNFRHAFALSFLLIAILMLPTVLAIKAIKPILSLVPGETVPFFSLILSTAVVLLPLCFALGLQFPLAVSFSGEKNAVGKIYGLEAAGAFFGGIVFTFLLSSRIDAFSLCLGLSVLFIIVGMFVSGKKVFITVFIFPLLMYAAFYRSAHTLPWQGVELVRTVESKYGDIAVIKVGSQSSLYSNGQLLFTYPDIQDGELKTHLSMSLHPAPSQILIIGGSPGILREFLKYPVGHIDFVELDPKIIRTSQELLDIDDREAVQNPNVSLVTEDGRRFVKSSQYPKYDLILINLPPPSTAGINRFYTIEFFSEAKSVLRKGGIIILSTPPSAGYIGRSMQMVNGSLYTSLRSVFPHVAVTAQEYGYLFASETQVNTEAGTLENRFRERGIPTTYFQEYLFRDIFSPFGLNYVRQRLGEIASANTDLRPSAYLYNLILWSEVHGGESLKYLLSIRLLDMLLGGALILSIIALLIFRKQNRVVYFSVFTTGFSGMTFTITTLLTFQAFFGYIYEMIGVLSATFMTGLWVGTAITVRIKRALRTLLILELLTVLLAVSAPFFFRLEILFYVLIFSAGVLTGEQFTTASLSLSDAGSGGKLYALDLFGSFIGASVPAIILIPLFGVSSALFSVALIKAFSAIMIVSTRIGFSVLSSSIPNH